LSGFGKLVLKTEKAVPRFEPASIISVSYDAESTPKAVNWGD
jgi:hypothetical protein